MSTNFFCPRCRERISSQGGSHATCPGCGLVIDLALADTNAGAPSFVPIRDLSGETIGRYQLHDCLGSGGMGTVYRATDSQTNRDVAIKLLSPAFVGQPDLIERFHREAQALAGLSHINIVGFHEEGQADGHHYITMEYVAGDNLEAYLGRESPTAERALEIVTAIAEALSVAHQQGIIHRDLKPANVIVTGDNVKVLDFGIAHIALEDLTLTHSNAILGTVNYMAPEQRTHAKEVDHRADIFSLGVIFYRILSGTLPLGSYEPPSRLNAEVPRKFDRVVERMLNRDPDKRHTDADALLQELHALDRPPSRVARISAWSAAAVVAVIAGATVLMNVNAADWIEPVAESSEVVTEVGAQKDAPQQDAPQQGAAQKVNALNPPPEPDFEGEQATNTEPINAADAPTDAPTELDQKRQSSRVEISEKPSPKRRKKKRAPKSTGRLEGTVKQAPAEKTGKQSYVGRRGSVLYVNSTAESDLIRPLTPGETVTILALRRGKDKQKWASVRTARGETGYVRFTSIQAKPPPPANKKTGKKSAKGSYPSVGKGEQALDLRDSGGNLSTKRAD